MADRPPPVDTDTPGDDPALAPTPRTAVQNAHQLKALQEKVKQLEAQLGAAALQSPPPKPAAVTALDTAVAASHSPGTSRFDPGFALSPPPRRSSALASAGRALLDPVEPEVSSSAPSPASIPEEERFEGEAEVAAGAGTGPTPAPTPGFNRLGSFYDAARPTTASVPSMSPEQEFVLKVKTNLKQLVAGRVPLVLVSTGSYNPPHLQHARIFYLARKFLTERTEYQVVGGIMSPSHDNYVKGLLRRFPAQSIPIKHRMAMVELAVKGSSWLSVGRWESTRRRVMDYRSVLKNVKGLLDKAFSADKAPRVMYLCGADHLIMCGPQTIKTFGCIACSRPGYTEELERAVGKKYRRLVHIVDDDALLPTALDSVSSTKVRRRLIDGKDVTDVVGEAVAEYLAVHRIGDKVAGRTPWTDSDKAPLSLA